jgi:hypothetical protein
MAGLARATLPSARHMGASVLKQTTKAKAGTPLGKETKAAKKTKAKVKKTSRGE